MTPAALAVASILGHDVGHTVRFTKFRNRYPSAVMVEENAPPLGAAREQYFQDVDQQMKRIASLGYAGLAELCWSERSDMGMTFYENMCEVLLIDPLTREANSRITPVLDELESIGTAPWGTPFTPSDRLMEALGLPPPEDLPTGIRYHHAYSGYNNLSHEIDREKAGLPGGDAFARVAWGEIMINRPGPTFDEKTGLFVFQKVV